jgi:hypothetical protein
MTTKTRRELVNQALANLGILAVGQSVSDEDVSKMDVLVDPVCEKLSGLGIYYVQDQGTIGPSGGEVESTAFLPIADYLANAAAAAFNLPADAKLAALAQLAEQDLRTISRPPQIRQTLRIDGAIPNGRRVRW